jgi:hypothetical protein
MQVTERSTTRDDQLLVAAASVFTLAVILHGLDHVRRGVDAIDRDVFWAGTSAVIIEVLVVVLACQRHRLAPLAALSIGGSLALGYVLVHFLPDRGWLSDSLPSATDASRLSWAAASLEVLAAGGLAVTGWVVLQHRGGLASATTPRPEQLPWRVAIRHPAVLAMVAGNAVILVLSFTDL